MTPTVARSSPTPLTGSEIPRVTRTSLLLAPVLLTALAVSGCGAAVRTGAAAVVGEDRITSTRLQQVVDRGLSDPQAKQAASADQAGFTRSVLLRLIRHDLLSVAARQEGVSVDGGAVDAAQDRIAAQLGGEPQLEASAAQAGIAKADLRQAIGDIALSDALADKLTASVPVDQAALRAAYAKGGAQYDRVRSAHILVASQALATSLLAQVKADPSRFAALAAQYSTDPGSKDKGGDLGFQGRGTFEKPFEDAIFGAKPGSFVLARTRFGFHVIHVVERQTTSLAEATPDLRRGLLAQPRSDAVNGLLARTAKRLGVKVNPRFGAWDGKTLGVVPVKDSVSRPAVPTPGATAPPAQ